MINTEKAPVRPLMDPLTHNLAKIEYEDGNRLKPRLHNDLAILEGLFVPCQDTLVIKLLVK